MSQSSRADYTIGSLRRLNEVELAAGEKGYLLILSDKERVRAALGDLLLEWPEADPDIGGIDEDALRAKLTEAFRGLPPCPK